MMSGRMMMSGINIYVSMGITAAQFLPETRNTPPAALHRDAYYPRNASTFSRVTV